MKKAILLLGLSLFLLVFCGSIFADDYNDVVTMKNGSFYRGVIVENKVNEYLIIELPNGNSVKIDYKEVDIIKIVKINNSESSVISKNADNPYEVSELNLVLSSLTLHQLKALNLDTERLLITNDSILVETYKINEKNWAALYSVGNLFIPSLGSFIQKDYGAATYQILSLATLIATLTFTDPFGESDLNYYFFVGTAINFGVSYLVGLISPFVYESNYNKNLRIKLH